MRVLRLSEDAPAPAGSNKSPETSGSAEASSENKDEATSVASSETVIQKTADDERLGNQSAMRLRSLGSRHVFVKDTAFQT